MLIRSWNVFHGNAWPPRRRTYLEEAIRLATEDRPDVVLLQEVPAWALARLGTWSGMTAIGDVAQRPRLGRLPIPTELGHALTSLNYGLFRSAFSGQGNAILLAPEQRVERHEVLVLNPRGVRRDAARELRLGLRRRLEWAKERRICSAVGTQAGLLLANLHATSSPDQRLPELELRRAAAWVEELAPGPAVLGGDFNVWGSAAALGGWSAPGPRIDHLLVRGATPTPLRVWPEERRSREGVLISDHAPVELELEL